MRIDVDMDACQSHGECVLAAPEVFELGDDDVLRFRTDVDESQRASVESAIDVCPTMAIRIVE